MSGAANLLAAASLGLHDALHEAVTDATGLDLTASTALVAMLDFTPAGSVVMLSRVIGLTHSGTVRLVDRLVALGYADRDAGADARSRSVRLTRAGRTVARKARRARDTVMHQALADLKPQQRQAVSDLAEAMVRSLARRRLAQRASGSAPAGGALCRLCDFTACGRDQGGCPAT